MLNALSGRLNSTYLRAAGTAAVLVDLLEIVIVKGNFVTGLHRVSDIALGVEEPVLPVVMTNVPVTFWLVRVPVPP